MNKMIWIAIACTLFGLALIVMSFSNFERSATYRHASDLFFEDGRIALKKSQRAEWAEQRVAVHQAQTNQHLGSVSARDASAQKIYGICFCLLGAILLGAGALLWIKGRETATPSVAK